MKLNPREIKLKVVKNMKYIRMKGTERDFDKKQDSFRKVVDRSWSRYLFTANGLKDNLKQKYPVWNNLNFRKDVID